MIPLFTFEGVYFKLITTYQDDDDENERNKEHNHAYYNKQGVFFLVHIKWKTAINNSTPNYN